MKVLKWIYFALGCFGSVLTSIHSWQRLSFIDATLVTAVLAAFMLRWLCETLAYQWGIPKEDYYR